MYLRLVGQLREIRRLFPVMVHVHAQARRVAHTLVAYLALEGALARVMLIPNVNLQVVAVREESVARRAFDTCRFAVPAFGESGAGVKIKKKSAHKVASEVQDLNDMTSRL